MNRATLLGVQTPNQRLSPSPVITQAPGLREIVMAGWSFNKLTTSLSLSRVRSPLDGRGLVALFVVSERS